MNLDILSNLHLLALSLSKPLYANGLPEELIKREQVLSLINIYSIPLFVISNIIICIFSSGYTLQSLTVALVIESLMTATFFLCCKRSNRAYKAINSCLLLVMGPILFLLSNDNLLLAMVFGFVIPNYILLLFQDITITWLSCFAQFTILNLLYIPEYRRMVLSLDYEQLIHFTDQHLSLMSACFLLGSFITLVIFFVNKNSSTQLQEAKIKSETALTMQEKFFYKFSHELKNPLTGLLGNLEMAHVENIDPRVKNLIGNAKVCGELLLQLINNILDSGKMEVGNLDINYAPVRVTEIFEKIWGVSSEMIKNKGLYGQLTIYKKMPPILMLDSYRVLQVMLNLVRNAVRFTTNGRISITVNWLDNPEITDSTFEPVPYDNTDEGLFEKDEEVEALFRSFEKTDSEERPVYVLDTKQKHIPDISDSHTNSRDINKGVLKIIVSDTGCGLDEDSVKGIFTLFPELVIKKVQEKTPTKGLSMWITQQVCEKMNGQIRLYSKPGRGSTFIVCISTESSRIDISSSSQISDEIDLERRSPATKLRALVMDDNPYNTDVIRKYLEKSHVEVVGCPKNGLEAINLYEKEVKEGRTIHIITMDLDMPLLDGKAACEKIREYEVAHNRPPCSILIVSGNCFETEIKECLNPNGKIKANYFIRKPMYFLEFQRLMRNIQANDSQNFRGPFNPKKVLIVDDDLFNLQFLGRLLSIDKHEYFEAKNGKEALEIYKKHWNDIAVIFMDCEMVVMDGYTSTREIRKVQDKNKLPKIKIFGVTGHTGLEHEMKCKEAGMNQTVSKPFRHDDIRMIITECVNEFME